MADKEAIGWTEVLGPHADNPPVPRASGETVYVVHCPGCDKYIDPEQLDATVQKYPGQLCECGALREILQFKASSLERGIKAQFEQHIRDGAHQAILEDMQRGDPEEADRKRDMYMANRHEYTWDGKHVRAARQTASGIFYLAYLLLRRCHPKLTLELATRIVTTNPRGWAVAYAWAWGNSEAPSTEGASRNGTPATISA